MIGVLIRFQFGADFDAERLRAVAAKARSRFEGMPSLISKTFAIDPERRAAVNFYVWDSERTARDFYTDTLLEQVAGLYGVKPALEFFEIAEHVDNAARETRALG